MFSYHSQPPVRPARRAAAIRLLAVICLATAMFSGLPASGQSQSQAPAGQPTPPPPEAGGPQTDAGPYAIPKKKDEPPPPPPPEKPKKIEGMADYSIHVDVPVVSVPVMVVTKDGQFISTLQKENFKIYEDGTQQTISNFTVQDAPITAVLLVEFASTNYGFIIDALNASYYFADSLKKDDWVAVEYFDMRPQILVDFTQDKAAINGALNQLRMPGFSETNLFDALYDALDRMDRIEGHKYIILVSAGFDSFSKINLDQITKKIKATKDVTIFPISIGWITRERAATFGGVPGHGGAGVFMSEMDYLQADNQMRNFAKLTGGRFYQPRFTAEYAEVFRDIGGDIRHQYEISYHPTNAKLDATYRKLKIEVIAPDGGPFKVKDQKGKDVKFDVIAREGYTAKHTVE
jgi:VWFA-related protein